MRRVGSVVLVVVIAIVGGLLVSNLSPIRNLLDDLFNHKTFVATGDVVLKKLQETKTLDAASATFEVPVVVCNGNPTSYDLRGPADKERKTPAQQLLDACNGYTDAKATVLMTAEVRAQVNLANLNAQSVKVSGDTVTLTLPAITLSEPSIDAETGVAVIAVSSSIPIFGGKLPDNYVSAAAGSAKAAVAKVAVNSGVVETGRKSAETLFDGMLGLLGYKHVVVEFAKPKA